jgi:hypothetical protein
MIHLKKFNESHEDGDVVGKENFSYTKEDMEDFVLDLLDDGFEIE